MKWIMILAAVVAVAGMAGVFAFARSMGGQADSNVEKFLGKEGDKATK